MSVLYSNALFDRFCMLCMYKLILVSVISHYIIIVTVNYSIKYTKNK